MFLRSLGVFCGVAVASWGALAFGQDAKPLDYTTVAVPVSRALAELGKVAGVDLQASGAIGKRIIILRLKGASLKDAMDRIALVTDGEWQTIQGGYRLIVSNEKVAATRKAELEQAVQAIRKSVSAKAAELSKQPIFDAQTAHAMALQLQDAQKRQNPNNFDQAAWQQQTRLSDRAPAGRALGRIVQILDPVELAGAPNEGRLVYSNVPTKMERRLPNAISGVIDTFMKEQAVWSAEAQKVLGDEPPNTPYFDPTAIRITVKEKPAKCLVIVTRYGIGSSLGVQLMLADAAGHTVGSANTQISDQWQNLDAVLQEASNSKSNEEPLSFTPASQRFLKCFQDSRRQDSGFPILDDESKKLLLNPEQVDPLGFMPSEGLIQIGERRKENVVAGLPDLAFFSTAFITSAANPSPTAFLQGIRAVQADVAEQGGWLTVRPKSSSGMVINSDRFAAGKLVRSAYKNGRLPLDDAAAFAASAGGPQEDLLVLMLVALMDPTAMQVLDSNWYCLKIYGMMNVTQRKMLESGQPIALRMLSQGQRAALEKMVYGVNSRLQMRFPQNGQPDADWELFNTGIYREPTESLPNGIPDGGTLSVTFDHLDVVFLGQQSNPAARYMTGTAMGVDELARQVYMSEHPDIFPWMAARKPNFDKLTIGKQLKLDFTFDLTDRLYLSASLRDSASSGGQAVTIDKLPGAMKKKYDETMEQMKQGYANAKPGQFTAPPVRSNPPPPGP